MANFLTSSRENKTTNNFSTLGITRGISSNEQAENSATPSRKNPSMNVSQEMKADQLRTHLSLPHHRDQQEYEEKLFRQVRFSDVPNNNKSLSKENDPTSELYFDDKNGAHKEKAKLFKCHSNPFSPMHPLSKV